MPQYVVHPRLHICLVTQFLGLPSLAKGGFTTQESKHYSGDQTVQESKTVVAMTTPGAKSQPCVILAYLPACRRSAVARQAAHLFAVLAAALGIKFEAYAITFMSAVYKGLVITVQVRCGTRD